jgi:hypothetical protein
MHGMSPKHASVFKDCYSVLLKNAEANNGYPHSQSQSVAKSSTTSSSLGMATTNSQPNKKVTNAKRKRKDLRICTGAATAPTSSPEGGIFLPDTPRRVLHTQLLLQLLKNPADESDGGGHSIGFHSAVGGNGPNKRKKRTTTTTMLKSPKVSLAMLPSKGSLGEPHYRTTGDHGSSLHDMGGSGSSFDHLDIDFNEVRSLPVFHW